MAEVLDNLKGEKKSVFNIINCRGARGGDGYLMRLDGANILVDTGYGFSAKRMIEKLKNELKDEQLDYILLTHSHYDHAMGRADIKKEFPDCKIIASAYCNEILNKPTARQAMRKMDNCAAMAFGLETAEDLSEELSVDIIVTDGDEISLGNNSVRIISLTGHTKCCIGYYFIKEKFLISCETLGIYAGEMQVLPGCLIGYKMTVDAINKAKALDINEILIPHSGILYGEKVNEYLNNAESVTIECKDLIVNAYRNGADEKEIVRLFKGKYYSDSIARFYPEPALMANLKAQIPMFVKECL